MVLGAIFVSGAVIMAVGSGDEADRDDGDVGADARHVEHVIIMRVPHQDGVGVCQPGD